MTPPDDGAQACPLKDVLGISLPEAIDLVHKKALWLYRGHQGDAEDLTQDVLEKLIKRATGGDLEITSNVEGFLGTVTMNQFIDQHRRRRRRKIYEVSLEQQPDREDESPGPEYILVDAEVCQLFEAAIARLRNPHQQIVRLAFFEGLSLQQIATRLGMKKSTVQDQRNAAFRDLRRFLHQHGWEKES